MKYAIIAAGEGSRLAEEGVALPKPLVRIQGEALIDRLIRIFCANDAEEVVVIVNQLHPETEAHVRELQQTSYGDKLRIVVKTTPSSMHSFSELAPYLEDSPFCLTTVDTIFREDEFSAYIQAFRQSDADALMAVTTYIDDEKPLYIAADATRRITAFLDQRPAAPRFISGGIYALKPVALKTLRRCMEEGKSRMRNYQRGLIEDGLAVYAHPFSKILDVDHASDIEKAESFLATQQLPRPSYLGVSRSERFSPGSVERDAAIFSEVCRCLGDHAISFNTVSEDELTPAHLTGRTHVFSMARSERALAILAEAEAQGTPVLNSARCIRHFTRARIVELFNGQKVPQPASDVCSTAYVPHQTRVPYPLWLKRGDACAQELHDVSFVSSPEELPAVLESFQARGVEELVVSHHEEGDLVKFYGVAGTDFFHFLYPTAGEGFSKFGLEEINGAPSAHPFSTDALKAAADRAAQLTGFIVYGGDCIVRPDGSFAIIDFNDWPSFSACREAAAWAISNRI